MLIACLNNTEQPCRAILKLRNMREEYAVALRQQHEGEAPPLSMFRSQVYYDTILELQQYVAILLLLLYHTGTYYSSFLFTVLNCSNNTYSYVLILVLLLRASVCMLRTGAAVVAGILYIIPCSYHMCESCGALEKTHESIVYLVYHTYRQPVVRVVSTRITQGDGICTSGRRTLYLLPPPVRKT